MSRNTLKRIGEAYSLFDRALNGDLHAKADVAESLTTSDFPVLLGQGYQRKVLAAYQAQTPVWQQYATRTVVPNFKPQRLVQILGGARGLSRVAEATEYPARDLDEALYEFSVEKYGDRIPLTWEMVVNDELGVFRGIDQNLAVAARDTEGTVTASAFFNANRTGLNTQFFKGANGNAPESAPLTRASLQDAIQALSTKKDEQGNPLVRPNLVLVVPPTLEFQAREILTASEIRTTAADGSVSVSQNPVAGAVSLVVEPNLLLNTGSNAASTWFLLPAPNSARPAIVTGFLAGNETPDLRVKADTGNRAGGGSIAPEQGSFDDDTIQYRVRHVVGAELIDPKFTFVSQGA